MDLDDLTAFVDVMHHGSFSAVARARGVAPSSISRAIASLEDELGVRLFQRTTRRIAPTEAGARYLERVEPIVEELVVAKEVVSDSGQTPRGTLRVTAPVSFAQLALTPLIPQFLEFYDELAIELLLSDLMIDLLRDRIDVAVRLGKLPDSSLVARKLFDMTFVVCASPAHLDAHGVPETPADLEERQCITFVMGEHRSRWWFRDRRRRVVSEVHISGRCMIGNAIGVRQCCVAGMGFALLPRWAVESELRCGNLVDVFPELEVTATDFDGAAWLVFPSRSYVPLKVRAFSDFVFDRMSQ